MEKIKLKDLLSTDTIVLTKSLGVSPQNIYSWKKTNNIKKQEIRRLIRSFYYSLGIEVDV